MIIEKKKISDLKPAPYNPRKSNEKQEANLKKSLEKFGVVEPIVFNKRTGYIVGGHFRIRELKKLGYKEVDCVIVDLNEDDEKELNIRLNANTGDWNWEMLQADWDLSELEDWGLDIPDWKNEEVLEAEEDDFDTTPPEEPITVLGDLYEIGEHRLLCGDSTDSDQVAKLMNGEKADMVFTDPPYEIDFDYTNAVLYSENCHVFIFNNDRAMLRQLHNSPFDFKKFFIFHHSGTAIPQEGGNEVFLDHVLVSHEINGKPKVRYNKGNGTRSVIKGEYRRAEEHKHEKPYSFLQPIIEGYTDAQFVILDFFAGGGSLFVASHKLKRRCYGLELDPKYCDVIVKRMLALDANLKIKLNGKEIEHSYFD